MNDSLPWSERVSWKIIYVNNIYLLKHRLHGSYAFYSAKNGYQILCILNDCQTYYLLTYLLTPWCRALLEKVTGLQLVKKFPAFHGTRRFITALTSVRHLSLSWARPIQSIYPHPTSWRSVLILSTHLSLGFPSGLFPSGFPTKTLYTPISSPIRGQTFWDPNIHTAPMT